MQVQINESIENDYSCITMISSVPKYTLCICQSIAPIFQNIWKEETHDWNGTIIKSYHRISSPAALFCIYFCVIYCFFYSCIFIAIKYAFTDTTNFLKNPFRFHIKSNKKGIYFIMICEIKCSLHFSFLLQWILGGSS